MSNNKQLNKDLLEMFFAPIGFGGYLIIITCFIICSYFKIDINEHGIIIVSIWFSYYLLWKLILKDKNK